MRSLVLGLLIANALLGLFFTYPRTGEDAALAERQGELDRMLVVHRAEVEKWERAVESVDRIEGRLHKVFGDASSAVPRVRLALLDLERGLPIERTSAEYRSEGEPREGFKRYKIRLTLKGDFDALYRYLDRASRLRAPLTPVDMSLAPADAANEILLLNVSWSVFWPTAQPYASKVAP